MKQKKSFCLIALIVFVCSGFSNGSQSDCVLMNEASGGQKQQDTLVLAPPVAPTFVMEKKYHQLDEKNIHAFIQDWESWSLDLRAFAADSVVNQAIYRIMAEYADKDHPDTSVFYSMPCCIEIRRYQGSHSYPEPGQHELPFIKVETTQALERFAYVPGFDSDKAILYLTPEIEKLLSQFLGGIGKGGRGFTDITDIDYGRVAYLERLFSVHYGHWGGYWHLCSMPKILRLDMYEDGIRAFLRTSWCSGESLFVPYDTTQEMVTFDFWIE